MGFQIQHRDDMNDDRRCDEDTPIIIEKDRHEKTKPHDMDKQFGSGSFSSFDKIAGCPTENTDTLEYNTHRDRRNNGNGWATDNLENLQDIIKWNNPPYE